ncbi:MAG: hypothetical protein OEM28_11400 [Nitrosopumilus sp.]|nr:hypothetical protein [Nitrosopumilus sp.]MDH3488421.1 hypothetical protein [Nitrosopumilus sp.]
MNDSLLDDVKALLDKDFGDDRILKQICRACENNEVISNYERNYVQKLAEKHLGKRPEVIQTPSIEKKPIIPDVVIPETPSTQKMQTFQPQTPRTSNSNSKNSKTIMGIAGVALIIIIAVGVSFSGTSDVTPKVDTPKSSIPVTLSIQSDLSSYNKKDLISISGISNTSGTVNLSIENPKNELVWAEQVSLKSNGNYSTLAIAGGQGWENSGTYTIKVDNDKETKSITFSFKA